MKLQHVVQTYADRTIAYWKERWLALGVLLLLFVGRVVSTEGYRLVTYCLFLYLLHCFIGFCTPIDCDNLDPFDIEEEGVTVEKPISRSADDSKPFLRKLPEFNCWILCMRSVLASLVATLFPIFNIPVYTPILVVYFFVLVYLTGIKIKKHMEKYHYNPFYPVKAAKKSFMDTSRYYMSKFDTKLG
ncbi:hypothetical protein NECID01_0753 [Nematocida sp. AWRm77]|nr:hypothetical protein NECID01_0753 [Nematocida sp. AWRm77]